MWDAHRLGKCMESGAPWNLPWSHVGEHKLQLLEHLRHFGDDKSSDIEVHQG